MNERALSLSCLDATDTADFMALISGIVTATTAAGSFVFRFKMTDGRATTVDKRVTINGFDTTKDKLTLA